MPPLPADCVLRIAFPPERRFLDVVLRPALGYVRRYPLGRPAIRFIQQSLVTAAGRMTARAGAGRSRLEIRHHRGTLRIVLRFPPGAAFARSLSRLARRTPAGVTASLDSNRRGSTLSIRALLPRPD